MKTLEIREGYLFVYYDGQSEYNTLIGIMKEIGETCRRENISKVLADLRRMQGESKVMDRFRLGAAGVILLRGISKVAIVYRIDSLNQFAENVAVNRGLPSLITHDMEAAKNWLGVE